MHVKRLRNVYSELGRNEIEEFSVVLYSFRKL